MVKRGGVVIGFWLLVVSLVLVGLVLSSCERLPGYNIPAREELRLKQPKGPTLEYFTGEITKIEQSIIGPKITVKKDKSGADRTFFLSAKYRIWLGINAGDPNDVSGLKSAKLADLKEGQRVASFVNRSNQAERLHILRR